MGGYDMMEVAALSPSSSDFEQMTAQLRRRLRPTPALTLADWLRVYLGLSSATDELREDFPPHDEIAQLVSLGPSDLKRQLSSVLSAILSHRFAATARDPRRRAANIAKFAESGGRQRQSNRVTGPVREPSTDITSEECQVGTTTDAAIAIIFFPVAQSRMARVLWSKCSRA